MTQTFEQFLENNIQLALLPQVEQQLAYDAYLAEEAMKEQQAIAAALAYEQAREEALRLAMEQDALRQAQFQRILVAVENDWGLIAEIHPMVTSNFMLEFEQAVTEEIAVKIEQQAPVLKQQKLQVKINEEAQAFLDASDFKVLRHLRESLLGISPKSMTDEEYVALEQERQDKAKSIVR